MLPKTTAHPRPCDGFVGARDRGARSSLEPLFDIGGSADRQGRCPQAQSGPAEVLITRPEFDPAPAICFDAPGAAIGSPHCAPKAQLTDPNCP